MTCTWLLSPLFFKANHISPQSITQYLSSPPIIALLTPPPITAYTSHPPITGNLCAGRKVDSVEQSAAHLVNLYHYFFTAACVGTITTHYATLMLLTVHSFWKLFDIFHVLWRNYKVIL